MGWHGRRQIQSLCADLVWNLLAVVCTDLFLWLYIPTVRLSSPILCYSPNPYDYLRTIPTNDVKMKKYLPSAFLAFAVKHTHFCCHPFSFTVSGCLRGLRNPLTKQVFCATEITRLYPCSLTVIAASKPIIIISLT